MLESIKSVKIDKQAPADKEKASNADATLVSITIKIPRETVEQLRALLHENIFEDLGRVAFIEWANWLLVLQRPLTIAEMGVARAYSLYHDVLHESLLPTTDDLSALLKISPGRARYLLACLRTQHKSWFTKCLLTRIRDVLQAEKPDKGGYYHILVPSVCKDLFKQLSSEAAYIAGGAKNPKNIRVSDSTKFTIGPKTFKELQIPINSAGSIACIKRWAKPNPRSDLLLEGKNNELKGETNR